MIPCKPHSVADIDSAHKQVFFWGGGRKLPLYIFGRVRKTARTETFPLWMCEQNSMLRILNPTDTNSLPLGSLDRGDSGRHVGASDLPHGTASCRYGRKLISKHPNTYLMICIY